MSNGQFTAKEIAAWAKRDGFSWVALELDDYGNDARWPAFRDACADWDLDPGVWVTEGGSIARTPSDAAFVIAECEGPGDYDGIVREQAGLPSGIPKAVAVNFNTPLYVDGEPNHAAADKLIGAGWQCLTECYLPVNPHTTPPAEDFMARQLGWHRTQPIFGVFGDVTLATYDTWRSWPGWSVYLGEYLW